MQAYLATGAGLDDLLAQLDLDWHTEQRIRFLAENVVEAIAPTNSPLLNPAAWKAAIDSRGANLAPGPGRWWQPVGPHPGCRRWSSPTHHRRPGSGGHPGAVVLRTEVFELIQYTPQTDTCAQGRC